MLMTRRVEFRIHWGQQKLRLESAVNFPAGLGIHSNTLSASIVGLVTETKRKLTVSVKLVDVNYP